MEESDRSIASAAQVRERTVRLLDSYLEPLIRQFLQSNGLGSKLASILPMTSMLGLPIPTPEKFLADVRDMVANMPETDLLQHARTIRAAVTWATEGAE